MVWSSSFSLKEYIRTVKFFNFPDTEDAVDIGEVVFGPQVPILQGEMIREKQRHVKNIPRTIIPHELVKNNPTDELDMDYFYVNGIVFLHTKSKNIKKLTTHRCVGTGKEECITKIDIITKMYTNRGFNITPYNGDNGFEMLRDHLGGDNLNIVGREDHVGAIERSIRTIKKEQDAFVTSFHINPTLN